MSDRSDRVEIFKGDDGQYYWRKVAPNGEIIAQGEGYTIKSHAAEGALRANPEAGEVIFMEDD